MVAEACGNRTHLVFDLLTRSVVMVASSVSRSHSPPDLDLPKAIESRWGHPTLYNLEIRGILRLDK